MINVPAGTVKSMPDTPAADGEAVRRDRIAEEFERATDDRVGRGTGPRLLDNNATFSCES